MSLARLFAWTLLPLLLPVSSASPGDVDFAASTGSFLRLSATSKAEITNFAATIGGLDTSLGGPELRGARIEVWKFTSRYAATSFGAPYLPGGHLGLPPEEPPEKVAEFRNAGLTIVERMPHGAIVIAGSHGLLDQESAITLGPPSANASLRVAKNDQVGPGLPEDWAFPWQLGFPSTTSTADSLSFRGPLRIRIVNATARVEDETGSRSFRSTTFTEATPLPSGQVRRSEFFEFKVTGGEGNLTTRLGTEQPGFLLRTQRFFASTSNVSSFDRLENITGRFPAVLSNGSSNWLVGRFSLALEVLDDGSGARQQIAVVGTLSMASAGGRPPFHFDVDAYRASLLLALTFAVAALLRSAPVVALLRIIAPLYTKLRKDDVLRVPARESLFRAIRESPGIHFLELRRVVGERGTPVAFGALAYHLSQLERFQLVTSKRAGRYRRYFETAAVGGDAARIALIQTQPMPLVARAVLGRPGASQAELHALLWVALPVTRQALAYHLRRLEAKELVVRESRGRSTAYKPTERLLRLKEYLPAAPGDGPEAGAPSRAMTSST